jgi:hypothetical protein
MDDNLSLEREHLAQADRHIAEAKNHIAHQKEFIERLKQDGHETDLVWLDILEDTLATFERHREIILKRLKEPPPFA